MTVHALFFCLRPDEATAQRLAEVAQAIARRLGLRERPSRADRLHVTLHHLGWYDDAIPEQATAMAAVRAAAERAAASIVWPTLPLQFDELLSFTRKARNRPLVLSGGAGLDQVRQFRAHLGERLSAHGLAVDPHFTPHLTLAYDDRLIEPEAHTVPGWTAIDFHLADSLQGQSRHVMVGRWPLGAPSVRDSAPVPR
jgi:RNA 2',3'-cyclic 3'-phosphodiesterase